MTSAWYSHLPTGTNPAEVDLLAGRSLPGAWMQRWAANPSQPTLHDDATGWVTAAELEARTRTVAGRLAAAELQPGQRLILSAEASVDVAVAHIAALRLGLVVLPANTAYLARELAHLVHDAEPAAAVVDDERRAAWLREASGDRPLLVLDPSVALPNGPDADSLDQSGPDDPAVLAYTSGTTGAPKGALLSHGNLLASAHALRLAWRWSPDDVLVLPLPLFHMHGLGVGLHGTLTAGAAVALRPRFDPGDTLNAISAHRASLFFGVPTLWSRLAASGRLGEMRPLRLGVSGSAPLDVGLHRSIAEEAGLVLIERYGMTETVMNVSNPYDGERRAGTVGLPLPGVEVRLDPATGEICLRGPNVFAGYWNRPDATAEVLDDGWFRSGDVGAFDGDGYLSIVGRRKELIISGGYNVYPREVEDVIRTHPAVQDVAVIGVAHPDWGEQVVAVIEGSVSEQDRIAIAAATTEQLAPYKRPKQLLVIEALPRNAMGKVVKAELRDLLG